MYGVRECSDFILLHVAVQFSQQHLLKSLSLLNCIFLAPFSKIMYALVHGFISGLSVLFYWSISLSLCQYHTVLITVTIWFILKSGNLIPPAPWCFLKIALAIWGLLCIHANFKISYSRSVKNAIGNLIGITLHL